MLFGGEDWFFELVVCGWCKYELLFDGIFGFVDIVLMNDVIVVCVDNEVVVCCRQEQKYG